MAIYYQIRRKLIVVCCAVLFLTAAVNIYAADTIKLGVIGPLKLLQGQYILDGTQLAVDEINDAGGVMVKGQKYAIKIIKADSNELLSIADAVQAMERLITADNADFIIGGFSSEAGLAYQEVVGDHKKIWLSPTFCDKILTERIAKNYDKFKYHFRVGGPNTDFWGIMEAQQLMMVIDEVKRQLGVKKPRVAIIVEKTIFAGHVVDAMLKTPVTAEFEGVGKWIVSRMASDVTAEMSAIKASNPHIILTVTTGPVGVAIAKTWGGLQIPAALIGVAVAASVETTWKTTSGTCNYSATNDVIGRVEITQKTIPFHDKVVKKTGKRPLFIITDSYDAIYILKTAIEKAGTIETEAVLSELEKTDYVGPAGRIGFFPKGHETPHDLMWGPGRVTWVVLQWRDGELVTVWPDGKGRLGDKGFENLRYKGTVNYELPPWMVKYWKAKK